MFTYFNTDPDNMRNQPELGGGGLPDIGVYPTVTTRLATGMEPQRVQATVEHDPDFGTDRYASVRADFGGFEADDGEWATERFALMRTAWEQGDFETVAGLEMQIWLSGPHRTLVSMRPEMVERMRGWLLDSYTKEPRRRQQELDPPTATRLGEITVPLLAVLGELDLPSLAATVDHLAASVPGARKVVMPGTAHLSPWEDPAGFVVVLRDFLDGL